MNKLALLLLPVTALFFFSGCDRFGPHRSQRQQYQQQDRRYDDRYDRYDRRYDRDRDRYDDRYRDRDYRNDRDRYPYDRDRYPYDRFDNSARYNRALLNLHNSERSRQSIPRLREESYLSQVALRHAEWMARTGEFSHRGINNSTVQTRVGRSYRCVGENIAMGYRSPDEAMRNWMGSYGHRKNVLQRGYTMVGFGVAESRNGTLYWCAVFAG